MNRLVNLLCEYINKINQTTLMFIPVSFEIESSQVEKLIDFHFHAEKNSSRRFFSLCNYFHSIYCPIIKPNTTNI